MKSSILLLILTLSFSCNQFENRDKEEKKKKQQSLVLGYFLGCQFSSTNPLFTDPYYGRYISDQKQYDKFILGDSTMDIACNTFTGYASSGTGCFPVSGNKIPDFETQLCVLSTVAPSVIIISTMGGNDLLSQVDDDEVIRRGKSFANALEKKYPNATKVWVKVHATRVDYANAHRGKTNTAISNYVQTLGWKVTDPDSCVGVDSDGRALQSYLLDAIHPNQSTALCIKNKIQSEYGITY